MKVFCCASCGTEVSARLSRMALPVHAHQKWGNAPLPVLMPPGAYAVDPEPWGPPWRRWEEIAEAEAEAESRGIYAPVSTLSFGAPGAIVIAPGEVRNTVPILDRCEGHCCGLDGSAGPNLACANCGHPVAGRIDDCSLWQAVWLDPEAVRGLPEDDPPEQPADWATAIRGLPDAPPLDMSGNWNPYWSAAVGAALAHLLAACTGTPVALPEGLATELFGPALATLLPGGDPAETLSLAGPGLPPQDDTDLLLVPRHPQTGEPWRPSPTARTVPLPAEIWAPVALPDTSVPVPAPGRLPDGLLRDDPLPRHPWRRFEPDGEIFLATLARLPAVRQPWLREIYDRVHRNPYAAFSF